MVFTSYAHCARIPFAGRAAAAREIRRQGSLGFERAGLMVCPVAWRLTASRWRAAAIAAGARAGEGLLGDQARAGRQPERAEAAYAADLSLRSAAGGSS